MIFGESFDEVVEYLIKVNHLYYVTSDDGRNILVNHPSCHNPARNMVVRHIDPLQINVFDDTINEVIDSHIVSIIDFKFNNSTKFLDVI